MAAYNTSKRSSFALYLVFAIVLVIVFFTSFSGPHTNHHISQLKPHKVEDANVDDTLLKGHAIAPKLGNETAKAELGRAAWKLFHTTFARFPDKPTKEESAALKSYIHLFQRLYPCGECAGHFGHILEKFPPQVSTRSAAAAWGCHVHNEVNKSLDKELFDCSQIGDFYDCGCADDDEKEAKEKGASKSDDKSGAQKTADEDYPPLELEREEYQRGG